MDQEEYYSKHLVITWSKLGRSTVVYEDIDDTQLFRLRSKIKEVAKKMGHDYGKEEEDRSILSMLKLIKPTDEIFECEFPTGDSVIFVSQAVANKGIDLSKYDPFNKENVHEQR